MDSFLPSGFQLPFQQRLSRLYNDTKKSSDFVKEPVQNEEDPEIKALHRKLRIQKDRLVTWGLEWSDPTQSAEIDESLSKAGLSEVVGSIMSTIKDILAEAEPLWLSSKHLAQGTRSDPDRKKSLVQWDKGRFEDLVGDLTSSIDTLYDLSRTRSMGAGPRRPSKMAYKPTSSTEYFRPFESTRMETPLSIRPDSLTHLNPQDAGRPALRQVVLMSKTAYYDLTQGSTREPWAPLLLEYATFDSIYSVTGIMPPMSRFEKLSSGLQQEPQRLPGTWTGLPRLLGYFEDMENSRFGLVYRFPPSFNIVSSERITKGPYHILPTLGDLLAQRRAEPNLEAKFRLAYNLANTVFDMHARGITHGNLFPRNVSFATIESESTLINGEADVRHPLVSSFDLFPEESSDSTNFLSRHPLDPRVSPTSSLLQTTDGRVHELYSLAMILLSIGLWSPLERLIQDTSTKSIPESFLEVLALKCGTLYMKAVQACWSSVDRERTGDYTGEMLLSSVRKNTTRFLEACCMLDDVSIFEEGVTPELRNPEELIMPKTSVPKQPLASLSKERKDVKSSTIFGQDRLPAVMPELEPQIATNEDTNDWNVEVTDGSRAELLKATIPNDPAVGPAKPTEKTKLYPHVPLPSEAVEKWNTILMPQINNALRHFYRKNPESVEISLESVGPNPANTQPTVLVVCTSVGKVRAILKKRFGDFFDGSTGFALKVCRGHVLRSRRHSEFVKRSMARRCHESHGKGTVNEDYTEAVNPAFQERPSNGASIGAWIGDRHLPPVSFGGLVLVNGKVYGMTVHHMLDDPERDFGNEETARCSGIAGREWFAQSANSSAGDENSYELSDTESEPYSESDITSDWGDDEEEDYFVPGDIPGVEPGCGDGYIVTQPAMDDVEEGFYPSAETEDEDHLDTFTLGEIYASSGIRRKQAHGLVHEVDWALFEFAMDRLPDDNLIPHAQHIRTRHTAPPKDDLPHLKPKAVATFASLPGLEVQCMARSSGLQTGQILPALTSVKIYGRTSPSHTYQITSIPCSEDSPCDPSDTTPIGIPGDSGAWIVDRNSGQLCGHVLAWSQRKRVAYICPMDVLLMDIAQTLEVSEIGLPGGANVALNEPVKSSHVFSGVEEFAPALRTMPLRSSSTQSLQSLISSGSCSQTPLSPRIGTPDLGGLSQHMTELGLDRGIGVSS